MYCTTQGNQYGDKLFLRSSLNVFSDEATIPAIQIGSCKPTPRIAAQIAVNPKNGPTTSFKLFSGSRTYTPLQLTPQGIYTNQITIGKWKIVGQGSDLTFENTDDPQQKISLGVFSALTNTSPSVIIGDWRIRQGVELLVFEKRIAGTSLYTPKMNITA